MAYRYASPSIRLYRGDAQPLSLIQVFNEATGDPIDLSSYDTATEYVLGTFYSLSDTAVILSTLVLAVTDAVNGWCVVEWDTDLSEFASGHYGLQVQLTTDTGTVVVQTVDRHVKIILLDPVGP